MGGTPIRSEHPWHERLVGVLERATGRAAKIDTYGWPVAGTGATDVIGANAYLRVMDDQPAVELALYPGDTLEQARAFYTRYNAQAGVRELRSHDG